MRSRCTREIDIRWRSRIEGNSRTDISCVAPPKRGEHQRVSRGIEYRDVGILCAIDYGLRRPHGDGEVRGCSQASHIGILQRVQRNG